MKFVESFLNHSLTKSDLVYLTRLEFSLSIIEKITGHNKTHYSLSHMVTDVNMCNSLVDLRKYIQYYILCVWCVRHPGVATTPAVQPTRARRRALSPRPRRGGRRETPPRAGAPRRARVHAPPAARRPAARHRAPALPRALRRVSALFLSLTQSFTHSIIHSLTHSIIHSLTRMLYHSCVLCIVLDELTSDIGGLTKFVENKNIC